MSKKAELFFIGGCSKSGTTWLQQMLNAHPTVACNGEAHFFDALFNHLAQAFRLYNTQIEHSGKAIFDDAHRMPHLTNDDLANSFGSLVDMLLKRIPDLPTSKKGILSHIGEKTPKNCQFFGQIAKLCPTARFIHCVRDPRDAITSSWEQGRKVTPEWIESKFIDFHHFCYMQATDWATNASLGLMYANKNPDRCLVVRYESLKSNTLETMRKVCEHLNIIADRELLCSLIETVRPEGKHFRKGLIGDWRNLFDEKDERIVEAACGDVASDLGYDLSPQKIILTSAVHSV
jgi:hypothetical protein